MKHVDHLCQQGNARKQGNRLPCQLVRLALAIVVFVEAVDALSHGFRKAQQARDVGAALAARGDQLLCDVRAVAQDRHHGAEALGQARLQARVLEDEFEHLRQAVAHRLEALFERQIIRQVELADARGIAAAAQVLQQQGVIQIPQVFIRHAQFASHVHADPATADAMAFWLSLRDVQGLAQGGDQFGKPDAVNGRRTCG